MPPPLGPCAWYVSPEQPKCGAPGAVEVTVKTKITHARVSLCERHKAEHDNNFMRARNERDKQPGAAPRRSRRPA